MKRMISIIALLLAPVMLLTACAIPGAAPKTKPENPGKPASGNNYGADLDNVDGSSDESSVRVWPWEDPSITLPAFTGTVTAPGSVKSLKVLAIGDASSRDALYFLPQIAKEAGIADVKVTVLSSNHSKTTLDIQWNQWNKNQEAYTHYENTGDGWVTVATSVKAKDVLCSDKWDYCILNTSIANSGVAGSISASNFGNLVQNVSFMLTSKSSSNTNTNYNTKAKLVWMQTWAYENNSRSNLYNGFSTYDKDQQKMYTAICEAVQTKVITNSKIKGVIPVGTAVQNMREAYWSDGLTRDSEYLSNTGKVLAALMVFKSLTGYDINAMELSDSVFNHARPHMVVIKESVNNAYLTPYAVTESVYHVAEQEG